MGGKRRDNLDEDFVRRAVEEIDETLRDSAWGRADWNDVARALAEALPDSAPTIVNYDPRDGAVNAAVTHGMDESFVASYEQHYVHVNPWLEFWDSAADGRVYVSEVEHPSESFRGSEFYDDWLAPQGNIGAAVGMRVTAGPSDVVHFAWHYDLSLAGAYDAPAAEILSRLNKRIVASVATSTMLRKALDESWTAGGLLGAIEGAAVLVDGARRIRDMNVQAAASLSAGDLFAGKGDVLSLREPAAQRWLEETVAGLTADAPIVAHSTVFSIGERVFRATASLVPVAAEGSVGQLIPPRKLVLVVVKLLVGGPLRLDLASLQFAYGLSKAEGRLCEVLMNGHSLKDAAGLLSVSDGTIRQRVKMVFHKTRTHRQGELVALLARFSVAD